MTAIPFFSLNVAGHLVQTADLTLEEAGALTRLLLLIAATPTHCLADDDEKLARVLGVPLAKWRKIRPAIETKFIVVNGLWRHETVEKERTFIEETREKRSRAANARWHGKPQENNKTGHARASDLHMQNDANFTVPHCTRKETLSPRESPKPDRRKPKLPFPNDEAFRDRCLAIATEKRPDVPFRENFDRFADHARSIDRRCSDWGAAWRNWLSRERTNHGQRLGADQTRAKSAGERAVAGAAAAVDMFRRRAEE